VSDTGAGIPEGDLPRLFERFYRVEKSRSRESGGSGVGLAISRALVEAMNGRIWAENGEAGAVFAIELPIAQKTPRRKS
jgi:signal transduction histidine kinase